MTTEEKLAAVNAALPGLGLPEARLEENRMMIAVEVDTSVFNDQQTGGLIVLAEELDLSLSITSHRVYLQVESLPEKWT